MVTSIFIIVDFSASFGPRNPNISPSSTSKETSFTALISPKLFLVFQHGLYSMVS
jgi:hypothetical protein